MWKHLAEKHWREFRPKMVKSLERRGLLEDALDYAVEAAHEESKAMRKAGSDPWGTREIVMQTHLLLPSEEDEPDNSLFLWPFF